MSEVDIEDLETADGSGAIAWNFQDLPDELILKVLNYPKLKDLISSGQKVSPNTNSKSLFYWSVG